MRKVLTMAVVAALTGCAGGIYPVPFSGFGEMRETTRHTGLDFAGQIGRTVYAAFDGEILYSGPNIVGGNETVTIWNEVRGLMANYMHLGTVLLPNGARVRAGQPIGTIGRGSYDRGYTPHLHFELLTDGYTDPVPWIADGRIHHPMRRP